VTHSFGGEYLRVFKRAYFKHLLFEEQNFEKFMTGGAFNMDLVVDNYPLSESIT